MTRDELVDKYRGCAARALKGEGLERSIAALEALETIPAVENLIGELTA